MRLKTDNGKLSLSTTQAGCTIQNCIPFDNLQPPEELPSTIVTHDMSIFGITQLSLTKLCQTCSIRVNKNKCPKQYYARVIVRNNDAKLNFTLFQQSLTEILDIYNKQNSEALDIAQISEEELEKVILSFDTLQFTYDFTNSRITKIEA